MVAQAAQTGTAGVDLAQMDLDREFGEVMPGRTVSPEVSPEKGRNDIFFRKYLVLSDFRLIFVRS